MTAQRPRGRHTMSRSCWCLAEAGFGSRKHPLLPLPRFHCSGAIFILPPPEVRRGLLLGSLYSSPPELPACTAYEFTFNGSVRGSSLGRWAEPPHLVSAYSPTLPYMS